MLMKPHTHTQGPGPVPVRYGTKVCTALVLLMFLGVNLMQQMYYGVSSTTSLMSMSTSMSMMNGDVDRGVLQQQQQQQQQQQPSSSKSKREILRELEELTTSSSSNSNSNSNSNSSNRTCPYPLVYIENQVVYNDNDDDQKIPRIIHLSHKSRCSPKELVAIVNEWKRKFPTYSVFFHDDQAVDKLFYGRQWPAFPHLHDILQCVKPGAMKIDVWRVLVTYQYGGIYSDIDNWPGTKTNPELFRTPPQLTFLSLSDAYNRPSQWFFAMEPKHDIAFFAMHRILSTVYQLQNIENPKVVFVTGPHVFRDGYAEFLYNQPKEFLYSGGGSSKDQGYKVGRGGKLIRKIAGKQVAGHIHSAMGWGEMTPHPLNATLGNVTVRESIAIQSGVHHWQRTTSKPFFNYKGACRLFLLRQVASRLQEQQQQQQNHTTTTTADDSNYNYNYTLWTNGNAFSAEAHA